MKMNYSFQSYLYSQYIYTNHRLSLHSPSDPRCAAVLIQATLEGPRKPGRNENDRDPGNPELILVIFW